MSQNPTSEIPRLAVELTPDQADRIIECMAPAMSATNTNLRHARKAPEILALSTRLGEDRAIIRLLSEAYTKAVGRRYGEQPRTPQEVPVVAPTEQEGPGE